MPREYTTGHRRVNPSFLRLRGPAIDRKRDDAHDVPPGRQRAPAGAAAGEPERVPAGEHVAHAREQAELRSVGARRARRRAARSGTIARRRRHGEHAADVDESSAGVGVGGRERPCRQFRRANETGRRRHERDRPGHADLAAAHDPCNDDAVRGCGTDRAGARQRVDVHDHAASRSRASARAGRTDSETAAAPSSSMWTPKRTDTRAREVRQRERRPQATSSAARTAKGERRRDAATRRRRQQPRRHGPLPAQWTGSRASGRAVPTSSPFSAPASSEGRACATRAAAPGNDRRRGARAVDGRRSAATRRRSRRGRTWRARRPARRRPASTAVEPEPAGGEAATRPCSAFAAEPAAPSASVAGDPAASRATHGARRAGRQRDDGHGNRLVQAEAARRERRRAAVQHDRGRTRRGGKLGRRRG